MWWMRSVEITFAEPCCRVQILQIPLRYAGAANEKLIGRR